MRRISKLMLLLAFMALSLNAFSQAPLARKGVENPDKWISAAFAKGTVPPFSFTLDGVPSAKFIKSWDYSKSKLTSPEPGSVQYSIIYKDKKSGLSVNVKVTGYTDFGAVEWVLRFKNGGSRNSGRIANVRSADFTVKEKGADGYLMRRCNGSDASVQDFCIIEEKLGEGSKLSLATVRGRSSDEVSLPFFNITANGAGCGLVYAIGWTGNWCADFSYAEKTGLGVVSGLANADFYLEPGEDVRTPMASVLFWKGNNKMSGHNEFRRFVLAHHSHKVDGKAWAPLCGGFDWGDPAPCNEYTCMTEDLAKAIVRRYKQFDIMPDVFWLDAGWYETSEGAHFNGDFSWPDTGTWVPDSERFPNGFINMSNMMHSYGAEFMVWFEPERVRPNSKFANEHPEYMMPIDDGDQFIFNLADPKALDYLCNYIGDLIEANGIDHYRQDFNTGSIQEAWDAADGKGRKGITEMKYIEGLYKYWDYLQTRFPRLQIDNCASGGRRFDLETVSRATPLWRTDYHYGEPLGYQCQTYGLNMFLPLSGTGVYKTDFYNSRSGYSSAMVMNFTMLESGLDASEMKRVYDEYRAIQPYFTKDYYPLSGFGDVSGSDQWVAYQLHDPATGCGYVVGFRRPDCTRSSYAVDLQAMSPNGTYTVTNCNTGESRELYGGDMMNGYVLKLDEAPDSILIKYEKQ